MINQSLYTLGKPSVHFFKILSRFLYVRFGNT